MNLAIEEEIYDERFQKTYSFLRSSLSNDLEKDIATLTNTIDTMVVYQGNDWVGRGELSTIKQNASIAAAEVLRSELMEELSNKKRS